MPLLIIQRGHCYRHTGATGTSGEQDYATRVAAQCQNLLSVGGWSVRATLADENFYQGDAFVAIHCDGSVNPTARGASCGYRTPEGQALGQAWKRAYAARGWAGGFRPDNYTAALSGYYGVRNAVAAGTRYATILECGFLTSPDDRALLTEASGPTRVALAIGDALGIPHGWDDKDHDAHTEDAMEFVQNDGPNGNRWAWVSGRNIIGCTPNEKKDAGRLVALGAASVRWIDDATWDEYIRVRDLEKKISDLLQMQTVLLRENNDLLRELLAATQDPA